VFGFTSGRSYYVREFVKMHVRAFVFRRFSRVTPSDPPFKRERGRAGMSWETKRGGWEGRYGREREDSEEKGKKIGK
jgi:hypothetical protein